MDGACHDGTGLESLRLRGDQPLADREQQQEGLPRVGEEVGGCLVEGFLGQGGMGTVFRARQFATDRPVALKIVRGDAGSVAAFGQRFAREARTAAAVSHPNVVHVYDFGAFAGGWYLVTEFVDGITLEQMVAAHGAVPPGRTIALLEQALLGLIAIADAGLVHRDIKPANLLIAAGDRLKIADFGLARPETGMDVTMAGQIIGTPAFMSLEQWRSERLDHRTDQYSLGVTAYLMLTGTKPFQGDNVLDLAKAVGTQEPVPPPMLNPAVDPGLAATVLRMMARRREDRFPDHRACLAALRAPVHLPTRRTPPPGTRLTTPLPAIQTPRPAGSTSSYRRRIGAPEPVSQVRSTPLPVARPTPLPEPAAPGTGSAKLRRRKERERIRERLQGLLDEAELACAERQLGRASALIEQAHSCLRWLQEDGADADLLSAISRIARLDARRGRIALRSGALHIAGWLLLAGAISGALAWWMAG